MSYDSPSSPPSDLPMPGSLEKPLVITVFGLLHIILGIFGLLFTIVSHFFFETPGHFISHILNIENLPADHPVTPFIGQLPTDTAPPQIIYAISIVIGSMMVTSGIALVLSAKWSLALSHLYCLLSLLFKAFLFLFFFAKTTPSLAYLAATSLYPSFALILLNKKPVREYYFTL